MDSNGDIVRELTRLRRRAGAARFATLSGRALLIAAVVLFAAVILRRYLRERYGVEILPHPVTGAAIAIALTLFALPVALRLLVTLRRPGLPAFARRLDRRLELRELLSSGLAAAALDGPLATAAAARAAAAARGVDAGALFPVRRGLARRLAVIPLLLALAYLLGLPSGRGFIPLGGAGEGGARGRGAADEEHREPETAKGPEDPEKPKDPEEPEALPPDTPEPAVTVRLLPAKEIFEADERVSLFLLAKTGEGATRARTLKAVLVLDGAEADVPGEVRVRPGPGGGAVVELDPAWFPALKEKLTPGRHRAEARLSDAGGQFSSAPVEFTIRGKPDDKPPPEPPPDPPPEPPPPEPPPPDPPPPPEPPPPGENSPEPPPPEIKDRPRFVMPLFREGDTLKKTGFALVPDPESPPGAPPQRVPLPEAAGQLGRRPESAVPVEQLDPKDRDTVIRYFTLLTGAR